jgi:hypothetical protein
MVALMMKLLHVVAAAGALALVSTGCGGSTSSGSGAAASSPAATTASSTSAAPAAPEANPAGDIPDNQVYVRYSVPGAALSVKVPEGWAKGAHKGAVTFTDKLNSITVETARAVRAPAAASVQPINGGHVTTVQRTSGRAVLQTYRALSKPDPVTGKSHTDAVERYLFFHSGTELILTLSGPEGADNVDPWRLVTDSVTWR